MDAHTWIDLVGRLIQRASTHNNTLPFWLSSGPQIMFFPLSAALSLAAVSTFDTLMRVTLTNWTKHIKGHGPDSAEIADWGQTRWEPAAVFAPLLRCCLSLFVSLSGPLGCSVCLRLFCGRSYFVGTVALVAKGIHEQTGRKFPMVPLAHCLFQPTHICLSWTKGFWLTGLAFSIWWMGTIICLRKSSFSSCF